MKPRSPEESNIVRSQSRQANRGRKVSKVWRRFQEAVILWLGHENTIVWVGARVKVLLGEKIRADYPTST